MRQIVIRQDSGLGNQLFQYAAGRYFAKKYQGSLRIAIDRPQKLSSHGQPRPFLLPKFAIQASFARISTAERLLLSISPRIEPATRPVRSTLGIQVLREPRPQPHIFDKGLTICEKTRTAYLVGSWQCYPPAQTVEDDLRIELSWREQPQGENLEFVRKIQGTPNAVSLHVRRGDYTIEYPDSVLPPEYYLKAIAQMRHRLGKPTFFIFSDEPGFAHSFAARQPDCIVVGCNDAGSAHEDLRLMSLCRHHIIANSTFSWWGAWLNPRKDKAVIAPSKWLKFETSQKEIALPSWSLI